MVGGIGLRHMIRLCRRVQLIGSAPHITCIRAVRFNSTNKKKAFDFDDVGFLESIILDTESKKKGIEETSVKDNSFLSVLEHQNKEFQELHQSEENNKVAVPDDQDVTETLNMFLNLTFDVEEPTKSFEELLQEVGNSETSTNTPPTAEDDILGESEVARRAEIVEAEAQVFRNVFDMYMRKDKETENVNQKDKYETYQLVRTSINNILDSNGLINAAPSRSFDDLVFAKAGKALEPTLNYIDTELATKNDVILFLKTVLERFIELAREAQDNSTKLEEVYLRSTLARDHHHNQGKETSENIQSEALFKEIAAASTSNPAQPILNVATLPVIFNQVLHVLVFKFADGTLPITLYNLLQQNLSLYTVLCNQQTYNEILRAAWIFQGKTLVREISAIYLEMVNSGFKGDIVTFNIVKQIVVDYYRLKVGAYSGINDESRTPIWSAEDDKYVHKLRRHLAYLSNRLRHTLNRSEK